ncbi:protein of unknown function [Rhodovastum atsumiense]|nr:protein of unknown function [Rhodovastum atsumiense]
MNQKFSSSAQLASPDYRPEKSNPGQNRNSQVQETHLHLKKRTNLHLWLQPHVHKQVSEAHYGYHSMDHSKNDIL